MNQPTQEYLESSNYDEVIHLQGGYTLGIGYCYVKQLNDMKLFQKNNLNYRFFQTKWGYCGQNFLFSALCPDNILILSSWANASATCGRTEKLFRIWKDILDNIVLMNVPTMMIEMPAAFHRCVKNGQLIDINLVKSRRQQYKDFVLKDKKHILCTDLYDYVPFDWDMISENAENKTCESPWHVKNDLIKYIFEGFLDFKEEKFNKEKFIGNL
jgi:hypothetical protein